MPRRYDVIVAGAGAAGMMCAIEAGRRGRSVLVVDHARAPGEKIRISGGGRCNFTNLHAAPGNFISRNPHFAISALRRYQPRDFIALVDRHGIAWHEKTLGQLFCDGSARQIVDMLLQEMRDAGAELRLGGTLQSIDWSGHGFRLVASGEPLECDRLVVATGGLSIPKMGASSFAYEVARRFGIAVVPTRPALVPLTFDGSLLDAMKALSGVSVDGARVSCNGAKFDEALLFTHRGLSGPAILQISSYWREGEEIEIALLPGTDIYAWLREMRTRHGRQAPATALSALLPRRLAQFVADDADGATLGDLSDQRLQAMAERINRWRVLPSGSEGYRTAEVTLGGIDTDALDQRTMAVKSVPGLHFVGECVDVTGWLGGYNFQWAWASGWAAGQAV